MEQSGQIKFYVFIFTFKLSSDVFTIVSIAVTFSHSGCIHHRNVSGGQTPVATGEWSTGLARARLGCRPCGCLIILSLTDVADSAPNIGEHSSTLLIIPSYFRTWQLLWRLPPSCWRVDSVIDALLAVVVSAGDSVTVQRVRPRTHFTAECTREHTHVLTGHCSP